MIYTDALQKTNYMIHMFGPWFSVCSFAGSQNLVFRLSGLQQFMPQNLVFEVSDCRCFFRKPGKSLGTGRQQKLEKSFESFAFSGRSGAQKCFKPRGWAAVGWGAFSAPFFPAILVFPGKKSSGFDASSGKKTDACGVVSGDCKKGIPEEST